MSDTVPCPTSRKPCHFNDVKKADGVARDRLYSAIVTCINCNRQDEYVKLVPHNCNDVVMEVVNTGTNNCKEATGSQVSINQCKGNMAKVQYCDGSPSKALCDYYSKENQ